MEPLNTNELCQALSIDVDQVEKWIDQGMPVGGKHPRSKRRRKFVVADVEAWLIEKGYAKHAPAADQPIVHTTIGDCAAYHEISPRTLSTYLEDPEFPGSAGQRGKGNSHLPAAPIAEYIARRRAASKVNGSGATRGSDEPKEMNPYEQVRHQKALFDFEQAKGLYILRDVAKGELVRAAAIARSTLVGLVPRLLKLLPDDIDPRLKDQFEDDANQVVDEICFDLGNAIELEGERDDD